MKNDKMPKGGPMSGFRGPVDKAKDFKTTFKKLLKYLKSYKTGIIFVIILAIGGSVFSIVGPKILGNTTTDIFNGIIAKISGTGGIDFKSIGVTLLILLGLYFISGVFTYFRGLITSKISAKVSYDLRKQISEKFNKLPIKYFDKNTHGEVLSRVTNDIDVINQNFQQILNQTITSFATLIGVVVMMLTINVTMTFATFLILPFSAILMVFVMKKSQKHFVTQQEYLGNINGQVEEVYGGRNIVKAFNGEKKVVNKFISTNDTLYKSAWKSQFFSGLMMPLMTFIGNLGYVLVSILGGWLAVKGAIQVGDIVAFTQYARTFMQPIQQISQITNLIQATMAASERVFELLEEEEEVEDIENPVSIENIRGNIKFDKVKFGYDKDKTIIKGFSADIKKGAKIAIVGPTGAGKTTIVKLLMRFYDVDKGKILIDGNNIKDFKRTEFRKLFGMVLQDPWLFNGTIEENIEYGKVDATKEELDRASEAAHVHHFIETLSDGYKTVIDEESSNISEGQKQLLTIARVILTDPKILILDEATSSVDTRTEILIQSAMDKLMEGRTSFIIAHRLSTIKNADLILVMNNGDIVEQGTHKELLKKKGFYEKLYNSQFDV